jgi:hypothetical protein
MGNRSYDKTGKKDAKVAERRVSYSIGVRLKDRVRIHRAMKRQDEIRKRHRAPQSWSSSVEIRKWRDKG